MSDKKYNGWTNYETWAVKLWMDNEQGTYDYWNEQAREMFEAAVDKHETWNTPSEQARYNLADRLKDEFQENVPEATNGTVYGDLIGAALSEVNWHEIANALLEDCEAEAENDDGETVKYETEKESA